MTSRRDFLARSSAAACATLFAGGLRLLAEPLGLPLGLQLYSVRDQLKNDPQDVLDTIGSIGYREVEAAGFFGYSADQVKQGMEQANLRCVSSHVPFGQLQANFDDILAYHKELGVGYLICSSPGRKPSSTADGRSPLTIDDWRWNAEQFNQMGAKTKAAGIQFGYHNHIPEFAVAAGGPQPYAELLRLTDPARVTFELDCGWAVVGGADPVELLRKYPDRISMLHVKDFKKAEAGSRERTATELGRGTIDYRPIFEQAGKTQHLKHIFVEQESYDIPWAESLREDADYLRKIPGPAGSTQSA